MSPHQLAFISQPEQMMFIQACFGCHQNNSLSVSCNAQSKSEWRGGGEKGLLCHGCLSLHCGKPQRCCHTSWVSREETVRQERHHARSLWINNLGLRSNDSNFVQCNHCQYVSHVNVHIMSHRKGVNFAANTHACKQYYGKLSPDEWRSKLERQTYYY